MKKSLGCLLISIFIFGMFLSSSHASAAKPVKLAFAVNIPATAWMVNHTILPWTKQVEDATNGRVTFEMYYSGSLLKSREVWKGLNGGIADIATVPFFLTRGLTTLTNVISLPFLEYKNAAQQSEVAWKLYEKFPEIRNEYKANKVLILFSSTPFFILTTEKRIKNMDDFKGLKLRMPGAEAIKLTLQSAGAIPVTMSASNIYPSLEKKVIDGTTCNWDLLQSFRFYELAKYYTHGPFNSGAMGVAMNQKKWDSLPKDVQDQIMSVSGLKGSRFFGENTYDKAIVPAMKKIKAEGYEMEEYSFSNEQINQWKQQFGAEIWDSWIKEAVAKANKEGYSDPKGLVQDLIATTEDLIKNYKP
jgi:TRAP-type C4-dicarboxylate transport system substrate-binding protein